MCHKLYKGLNKNKWLRNCVWRIAYSVVPTDDGSVQIAFHGAWPDLLQRVFARLQGCLFTSFDIVRENIADMVNGKCNNSLVVTIANPDLHRAGVSDICLLIESLLHKTVRCQVVHSKSYDAFLND